MDIKKDGSKKESGTSGMDTLSDSRRQMEELKQKLKESLPNLTSPKDSSSSSTAENTSDESQNNTPSPCSTKPKLTPY